MKKVFYNLLTAIIEVCVIFRSLNIKAQFFPVLLYTLKYLRHLRIFKTQLNIKDGAFADIRNSLKSLAIFFLNFILDVWLTSRYTSVVCFSRVTFNKIISKISDDM